MKRIIAVCVSILIMVAIFMKIDIKQFVLVIKDTNIALFVVACLFFIPQILVAAYRWIWIIRKNCSISMRESASLILAGSSLNLILPSKMGDLSKAYFLKRKGSLNLTRGFNLVLYEKLMDVGSLCLFVIASLVLGAKAGSVGTAALIFSIAVLCVFPLLYFIRFDTFASSNSGSTKGFLGRIKHFLGDAHNAIQEIKQERGDFFVVLFFSLFLWFLHLSQFLVFFRAVHSSVPASVIFGLTPIAIFIGILPFTIAGIGTRDAAFIFLFSPYEPASLMISVGLFATFRYVVCGALGLPFFNRYMVKDKGKS